MPNNMGGGGQFDHRTLRDAADYADYAAFHAYDAKVVNYANVAAKAVKVAKVAAKAVKAARADADPNAFAAYKAVAKAVKAAHADADPNAYAAAKAAAKAVKAAHADADPNAYANAYDYAADAVDNAADAADKKEYIFHIRFDYELLLRLSELGDWNDKTPVPPYIFGQMWRSELIPDNQKKQQANKDSFELSSFIDVPKDATDEEKEKHITNFALAMNDLYRAYGGSGLRIKSIHVPEGKPKELFKEIDQSLKPTGTE